MKIGIVGVGVVGGACRFGFELLGHDVFAHDIQFETSIDDVLDTQIVFVCVPTPPAEDRSCDVSIVREIVHDLKDRNYEGILAIKSTVVPGTTDDLANETGLQICFVPEFLREHSSVTDFTEAHDICIIGTDDLNIFNLVKECHGHYPSKFVHLEPKEAEFCKYFNNIFNATLITFANSFFEICKINNVNYTNVKNAITNRDHIKGNYHCILNNYP
tara:strand:- start:13 stop:660 length:648 start_codon:yes stop_codon:yes gene_type:complete